MNDLEQYFANEERIRELEAKVSRLGSELESTKKNANRLLRNAYVRNQMLKRKYEKLGVKAKDPSRSALAREEIRGMMIGGVDVSASYMAIKFSLSIGSIKRIQLKLKRDMEK